jgi:GT2 family glycosyltransferase
MSRIAVLIPVFNQPEDLRRTLRSMEGESAEFDAFVIDDGSQPPVALNPGEVSFPVELITLPRNCGCTRARNVGLAEIMKRGYEYVALHDAGDVDVGERMALQAAYLDAHTEVAVVGGWAQYVDRSARPLYVHRAPATSEAIRARMPYASAFANPATMIRANALREVGYYDEHYPIASDYEMFLRLTRRFETANLQQVLILKEDNPNNLSIGQRRRSLLFRLRAQCKHFNWLSVGSYLGVLSTLALLLLPYRIIVALKSVVGYAK